MPGWGLQAGVSDFCCIFCLAVRGEPSCDCRVTLYRFLVYLRDDVGCVPCVDDKGKSPVSNKQLMRWVESGAVRVNGEVVRDPRREMTWPVGGLSLFSREKRVTLI